MATLARALIARIAACTTPDALRALLATHDDGTTSVTAIRSLVAQHAIVFDAPLVNAILDPETATLLVHNPALPADLLDLVVRWIATHLTTPLPSTARTHLVEAIQGVVRTGRMPPTGSAWKGLIELTAPTHRDLASHRSELLAALLRVDTLSTAHLERLMRHFVGDVQAQLCIAHHPAATPSIWRHLVPDDPTATASTDVLSFLVNRPEARRDPMVRAYLVHAGKQHYPLLLATLCTDATGPELRDLFTALAHRDPALAAGVLRDLSHTAVDALTPSDYLPLLRATDPDTRRAAIAALAAFDPQHH